MELAGAHNHANTTDTLHMIHSIKNKPYVEERDAAGRPDADLAAEAWANYRLRNDSAIVDHFQVCLCCACVCVVCVVMT